MFATRHFTALVFFLLFGSVASAQSAMQCVGSTAPPNVRSTGRSELVSDLLLTCTGGIPTPAGRPVPQGTIAVILDSAISSRLLATGWSEALLLADEPAPGTQNACAASDGVCPLQGTGNGVGVYDGTIGKVNVFQGQPASANEVDFVSIPFDPPGTNAFRTFRITNLRVDANTAPASGRINMQVSAIGPSISFSTGLLAANAQSAASFAVKSVQAGPGGITQFTINVAEKFANVFRTRTSAPSAGNNQSPIPANQNTPGQLLPGSESGFYNPSFPILATRGNLGRAGLADSGTRILVQFSGPGSGATISTNAAVNLTQGGVLRLVSTDASGAGPFAINGACCGAVNLVPDASGNVRAVFEVLGADPAAIENVDLPFFVASATGAASITSITATVSLAPLSDSGTALASSIPHFGGSTTLNISASAVSTPIQVSTQQLQFVAPLGGDSPAPQMVSITTTASSQAQFTIQADAGTTGSAAPSWLVLGPVRGQTPANLSVSVNAAKLAAGNQTARIRVVPKDGTQAPVDIIVTLSITVAPPQIDVAPRTLSFVSRFGAAGVLEQPIIVRNRGGGTISLTTAIVGGSTWLKDVTPSSAQTAPDTPILLRVHANAQGLTAGVYTDVIRLTTAAGSVDVPVTVQVIPAGPVLRLGALGLRFQARQGNPASGSKVVQVINAGDPGTSVSYVADLLQGSDWLSLANGVGTALSGKPASITLVPAVAVSTFPAGPRYAVLRVTDTNAQGSPQFLTAVLDAAPANTPPFPEPTPAGLVFVAPAGSAQPPPQVVSLTISSVAAISYQAGAVTRDGADWLTVAPTAGVTSSANPAQLQISVTPAGLKAGVYSGQVDVSIGALARTVRITFIIQPSVAKPVTRQVEGCTPAQLVLTESALADFFMAPVGFPAFLSVFANDNCGTPVTDASLVASFDNGDVPIRLDGDGTGVYSGTWAPGRVSSSMTVMLTGTKPDFAQSAVTMRSGIVISNPTPPPVQFRDGTVNNNNPVGGAPLAPGTIASIYGTALATLASTTTAAPLPTQFRGTEATVGGRPAPLYYVSDGQVNIQIPFEVPLGKRAVLVTVNGVPAIPDNILVAQATPAVIAFPDGIVKAQRTDYSLIDTTRPAKPGETLTIYLVGMGAVTPAVKSADGSPVTPLAEVKPAPIVTLDGIPVVPSFTGLTPGFVGLYQMNFIVPSDVHTGNVALTVQQGNLSANVTMLPVAR